MADTVNTNAARFALRKEIAAMRRTPDEFRILRESHCKFCGKRNALDLGHPNNPTNAGSWCPQHGWLRFDSPKIPPISVAAPRKRKAA